MDAEPAERDATFVQVTPTPVVDSTCPFAPTVSKLSVIVPEIVKLVTVEAPDTLRSPDTSNLVTVEIPDTLKVPFTSNLAVGTLDPIPTLSVLPSEKIRLLSFNPSTRKSRLLPPSLITTVSILASSA